MSSSWGARRFSRMSLEYWFANSPGDLYYSAIEKIAAAMPAPPKPNIYQHAPRREKRAYKKSYEDRQTDNIIRLCQSMNELDEAQSYADWARKKGFSEQHIKAVLGGRY